MLEFTTGSEIIARAAIAAGCNFFAGYPITPATGILLTMYRLLPQTGGIVIQGEDEIASMGFCLGASACGKKPMLATSGPGLSLCSENIGFAQMTELPLVIVNVQRMGPATGGATTNAEGDIQFTRWVTSGGYPIICLAPTTIEECYPLAIKAFNLAERFRTPVILSTSKDLVTTRDSADPEKYKTPQLVNREAAKKEKDFEPYGYKDTADIPQFAPIGGDILTRVNTSTHNKKGIISCDPQVTGPALQHLNDKIMSRLPKIETVGADIEAGASTIIVAYGTMARTSREVVRRMRKEGKKISLLVIHSLWPVPEKSLKLHVGEHKNIIIPELNLGQYSLELERLFPRKELIKINRIDGKLISPEMIMTHLT